MAKRITIINQLRPKIISQDLIGFEKMAERIAKNTTYNAEEVYSILRLYVEESIAALERGETVKMDRFLSVLPNMQVGGEVDVMTRRNRALIARLNNPRLWTADKVSNHANLTKSPEELVELWDESHPDDPVTGD